SPSDTVQEARQERRRHDLVRGVQGGQHGALRPSSSPPLREAGHRLGRAGELATLIEWPRRRMLAPMGLPKPLPGWSIVAAFALIGVALLVTAWSTRSSINEASVAVGNGETFVLQANVREDLVELGGPPTSADLDAILKANSGDGLRYIALLDSRG